MSANVRTMNGYTKLASSIITSSIWRLPDKPRLVWITMLALANQYGEVEASVIGLAALANVDVEDCEKAIDAFLSPDKYSRTPDEEGRRVEPIDGGWRLINHAKYRRRASADERREKDAERKRRVRAVSANVRKRPLCPDPSPHLSAQAEADADPDPKEAEGRAEPPTVPEVFPEADYRPEPDIVWLNRQAAEHGWLGSLFASERTKQSAHVVIELAKKTAENKGAPDWRRAFEVTFGAWIAAKPTRINLQNWPAKLAEDWHQSVRSVDGAT